MIQPILFTIQIPDDEILTEEGVFEIPPACHSRASGNPERSAIQISKISAALSSTEEMENYFQLLNNRVPKRHEGRYEEKQIAKEIFCLERYLLTLATQGMLQFPIVIEQRESPDFCVSFNGVEVGIEVTEATTKDYQKFLTKTDHPDYLADYAPSPQIGVGDSQQRFVRDAAVYCIQKKIDRFPQYKINLPNCHDWRLLIYENIDMANFDEGDLQRGDTLKINTLLRNAIPQLQHDFTEISVITGRYLLHKVNKNSGFPLSRG